MHKKAGLCAPIQLDMCDEAWADNIGVFDAIFCANMIHIAPWPATLGLASGAKISLKRHGTVFLYGPFLEGQASVASNIAFSARLKAQNPDWGVRSIDSVKHIFAKQGFNQISRRDLPANNLLLGFSR